VVSVIVIRPKVRGFKPSRGRRIVKGDENPFHDFFRRGSKAFSPHVIRFYGMLKETAEYEIDTSSINFMVISCPVSPDSPPGVC
jgi:hypothetical protein